MLEWALSSGTFIQFPGIVMWAVPPAEGLLLLPSHMVGVDIRGLCHLLQVVPIWGCVCESFRHRHLLPTLGSPGGRAPDRCVEGRAGLGEVSKARALAGAAGDRRRVFGCSVAYKSAVPAPCFFSSGKAHLVT